MREWIYADTGLLCGGCAARITKDEPMVRITLPAVKRVKFRCQACAGPLDVDALEALAIRQPPPEPLRRVR